MGRGSVEGAMRSFTAGLVGSNEVFASARRLPGLFCVDVEGVLLIFKRLVMRADVVVSPCCFLHLAYGLEGGGLRAGMVGGWNRNGVVVRVLSFSDGGEGRIHNTVRHPNNIIVTRGILV